VYEVVDSQRQTHLVDQVIHAGIQRLAEVQGIGWALNEAYRYDEDGALENASFLDYRIPVASDLPMIDTVIVEVPNSRHPLGVRGVGEAPIIPPLAAVASAVSAAIGCPVTDLPCTPERILTLIEAD